jgi:Protein of unknown function (DUF1553)/Protein of unknown function (DUF1549)/Planctomycete cytochrome C
MRISILAAVLLFALPGAARADEPVNTEFFEKKVRPILAANCLTCHGKEKQKGELRLDTKAGFMKGGETGPLIVPGDPAKSRLLKAINYADISLQMPKKGKMSDADIATLTAWVKGGAPWPDDNTAGTVTEKFDPHVRAKVQWSFQPIRRPAVPVVANQQSQIANPIDAFLLKKLNDNGLSFAPPADKPTLLRRVYFDLTGLPPTPEEIAAFLKDDSPTAYEKVVEKLLASPAYGERWGRHWLDLVRYAETHGHEFDFEIVDAWRYRDYVIRAFNADVPFDQFLTEHIAGDLLANPRRAKDGTNESLLATAFWWLGEAKHSPVDSRAEHADRIDNQIDVFGKSVLGLTLACARCHDHKFDPIATKDYYALFSVLASSRYNRAEIDDPAPTVKLLDEMKSLREQLAKHMANPDREVGSSPQSEWRSRSTAFEKFDAGWRSRWDASGLAFRPEAGDGFPNSGREARKLSGALRSPTFTIEKPFLAIRVAGRDGKARVVLNGLQLIMAPIYGGLAQGIGHGEELRWMVFDLRMWTGQRAYLELLDDGPGYVAISEAWFADNPPPGEPAMKVSLPEFLTTDKPEVKKLVDRIRELEAKIPDAHFAPTIRDGTGIDEHVFVRGDHKIPGVEAPRAFLEVFDKPAFTGTGSGRLQLAKAITDPTNPLVSRVIVNRLWEHHFGEGIVRSPDNFGKQGELPTHPELLDWLASELVERKWSLKQMHRLMVLSTAYRQSSNSEFGMRNEESKTTLFGFPIPHSEFRDPHLVDPQNKLLHKQNVHRLEAEAIRDSMLVVSGRIDRTMEGPGILPYLTEYQVGRGKPPSGPLDGNGRRSVYLAVRRNFLNPMFTAFDYPTPFTCIGRRTVSNVPAQALVMLNNPFVLQQAELWAKRTLAVPNQTTEQRVNAMYESAFGRSPTKRELSAATEFLTEQAKEYGKPNHPRAWADLAHVLFNAKEFIFVE